MRYELNLKTEKYTDNQQSATISTRIYDNNFTSERFFSPNAVSASVAINAISIKLIVAQCFYKNRWRSAHVRSN